MSKYVNQFNIAKDLLSKRYISNDNFTTDSIENIINDIRLESGVKIKTIKEVIELYEKKKLIVISGGYLTIAL